MIPLNTHISLFEIFSRSRAPKVKKGETFSLDIDSFGLDPTGFNYSLVSNKKQLKRAEHSLVFNRKNGRLYYNSDGKKRGLGDDGGLIARFPKRIDPFEEMFSWDYSLSGAASTTDTSMPDNNNESNVARIASPSSDNIFLLYDTKTNKVVGVDCIGYDGPGGPCYDGPGGPMYDGPGGAMYDGPGGPMYDGPGGAMYDGPGGPMYDGPGGPMYDGPGGPMYDGPGGAMYDGPGGPMYDGPGGAMYDGPGGAMYAGPGGPMYDGPGGPMYDGPGSNLGSFTSGFGLNDLLRDFGLS